MAEQKEFIGIEDNQCVFQGKVLEDPTITGDKSYAFLKLRATTGEMDANGQWHDTPMEIPLIALSPSIIKTIEAHVRKDRRIKADCYYKNWTASGQQHHGFMIVRMKLGRKPFEQKENTGGGPTLPPPNFS
jgi:hypothetical protein